MAEYGRGRVIGPGAYWPQGYKRKRMLRNSYVEHELLVGKRVALISPQGTIYAKLMGNYTAVEFAPPEINGVTITWASIDEAVDTP